MRDLEIWKTYLQNLYRLNSIAKLYHSWVSIIITIRFLHSVPKLRHVEYWSILCIIHRSTSILYARRFSTCKVQRSINFFFFKLSIQIHPKSLNWTVEVHEPWCICYPNLRLVVPQYYVFVEIELPSHLHWTRLNIYFPHIRLALKNPCLFL